jgi:hypothetical protein
MKIEAASKVRVLVQGIDTDVGRDSPHRDKDQVDRVDLTVRPDSGPGSQQNTGYVQVEKVGSH